MGEDGLVPHDSAWQLVVPLKSRHRAKTRLEPPRGISRSALAYAMARDTLQAATDAVGAAAVWVVSTDLEVQRYAAGLGCQVVDDADGGLNAAVEAGLEAARPAGGAFGVLLGDLPALRPRELHTALRRAAEYPVAAVADRHDEGTTLLTGQGVPPVPAFGPGSARLHRDQRGAALITDTLPGLRCDVDVRDDLWAAVALGLGPHTSALLELSCDVRAPAPCPP